jgi:hypothetical protein
MRSGVFALDKKAGAFAQFVISTEQAAVSSAQKRGINEYKLQNFA